MFKKCWMQPLNCGFKLQVNNTLNERKQNGILGGTPQ